MLHPPSLQRLRVKTGQQMLLSVSQATTPGRN